MKKIFPFLIFFLFFNLYISVDASHELQNYLKGKFYKSVKNFFLVATEKMKDPRFKNTVILMLGNDESGSWGIVVNKPLGQIPLSLLINDTENIDLKKELRDVEIPVYWGGPVNESKILILHSKEYENKSTKSYKDVSVSSNYQTLLEIAEKKGPKKKLIILGISSWGSGQLEGEMEGRNDWSLSEVNTDLIFEMKDEKKWLEATNNSFIFL